MNYFLISFFMLLSVVASAQHTVEECQRLARNNYPLIRQYQLVEKTLDYNLKNAAKGYLPQGTLGVQATYQSATTEMDLPIVKMNSIPKDQYQAKLELNQVIWDGGMIRGQKNSSRDQAEVDSARVTSTLYAINERVNSLCFGLLMLDEQMRLVDLLDEELGRNFKKVKSYISAGVATSADLDAVEVEILTNRQKRDEVVSVRKAYQTMLSLLVGEPVESVKMPSVESVNADVNRNPELDFIRSQIRQVERQNEILKAVNMPKIGAFAQLGYGNLGLNMFKSGFTPYGIVGGKVSWNFASLYTKKSDRAKIMVQKQQLENQLDVFLFNSNLSVTQLKGEVDKLNKQMTLDDKIIELRGNIKRSSEAKVAAGTLSVTDMLRDVTSESSAMLQKALHKVELIMNIYNIKYKVNQ